MAFLIEEKRCTSPNSKAQVSAVIGPTLPQQGAQPFLNVRVGCQQFTEIAGLVQPLGLDPLGSFFRKAEELASVSKNVGDYVFAKGSDVDVRIYGDAAVARGSESWEKRNGERGAMCGRIPGYAATANGKSLLP
jgi:hypothetical protein